MLLNGFILPFLFSVRHTFLLQLIKEDQNDVALYAVFQVHVVLSLKPGTIENNNAYRILIGVDENYEYHKIQKMEDGEWAVGVSLLYIIKKEKRSLQNFNILKNGDKCKD